MKKRPYSIAILIFIVLIISAVFLIRIPFISHRLIGFAGYFYGYRIKVENLSLSRFMDVDVSGLEVIESPGDRLIFASRRLGIETRPGGIFKGEVEKLILTEPKLQLRLDGGKKTGASSIKKIPPVDVLVIKKGELQLSFGSSSYEITFKNIDLQVNKFSPEKGGDMTFEALVDVSHPGQDGFKGKGHCKGNIRLTGLMPDPIGTGSLEVHLDTGSMKAITFKDTSLKFSLKLEKNRITYSKAILQADTLVIKGGDSCSILKKSKISADIVHNLESGKMQAKQIKGEMQGLGVFQGVFETVLKGSFPWKAGIEASNIDFAGVFSLIKPLFEEPGDKIWSIQGRGAISVGAQGNMSGDIPKASGEATMKFLKGGFSSADGTKAGQGIEGKIILKFRIPSDEKKADAVLLSELFSGEYLWGKYYKDLTKEQARFSTSINISLNKNNGFDFYGPFNLFDTGEYACRGHIGSPEWAFSLSAKKISCDRFLSFFLYDYLSQSFPSFKGAQAQGIVDADINTEGAGDAFRIKGDIKVSDASLSLNDKGFLLEDIDVDLPINLVDPPDSASTQDKKQTGLIHIGALKKGIIDLADLHIPLIVSNNSIVFSNEVNIPFYNGQINILQFMAENIHAATRRVSLTATVKNIDISSFLQELTGIQLPGKMEAAFPMVKYQDRMWITEGKTLVNIFGGELEISDMYAKDLFLSSRKIGGNIYFNNINLGNITDAIQMGRITGIIKGFVKNLEIEYGQPSRFVFEVDSVKKKGIDQKISVDAIENISILGTGSDVVGIILKSGINRFFKEYPYSRMGVRCVLENDNFHIRGKILESGKEYLIRRAFLRGIDVINRDPENIVSFKDMQERVSRVFKSEKKASAVNANTN